MFSSVILTFCQLSLSHESCGKKKNTVFPPYYLSTVVLMKRNSDGPQLLRFHQGAWAMTLLAWQGTARFWWVTPESSSVQCSMSFSKDHNSQSRKLTESKLKSVIHKSHLIKIPCLYCHDSGLNMRFVWTIWWRTLETQSLLSFFSHPNTSSI